MKRFILKLLLFSIPFIALLFNYFLITKKRECRGDLAKLELLYVEKGYYDKHTSSYDTNSAVDVEIGELPDSAKVLVFGDSFANRKPFRYQQTMGEKSSDTVINVRYNLEFSPEDAALTFLQYSPQEKMPKAIVVESVERYCIHRLCGMRTDDPIPFDLMVQGKKRYGDRKRKNIAEEASKYYRRRLGIGESQIITTTLNQNLFSSKGYENVLISYYEDTNTVTDEKIKLAINKLYTLHRLADSRNVKLIYFIPPNKSTVYYPFLTKKRDFVILVDNNSPFDSIPYVYSPIDILRTMVESGIKDVYYIDDTHWTPVTSHIAGKNLRELLFSDLSSN